MRRTLILAASLAALALALLGGVLLLRGHLRALQDEHDALEQRRADLLASTAALMERKKDLADALDELEKLSAAPAPNEMAFYSAIQQAPRNNGVDLLSIHWTKPQRQEEGLRALALFLRGGCYEIAQVLASWRGLPMALRVASLKLRRSDGKGAGLVEAEVTLEALVGE